MTHNQIEYQKLQEDTRHNLAVETETNRNNVAVLGETNRHNVITENETGRHNVVTEKETNRHNVVNEDQGYRTIAENIRHNLADEGIRSEYNQITGQHYVNQDAAAFERNAITRSLGYANVNLGYAQNAVAARNAVTNERNAETNAYIASSNAGLGYLNSNRNYELGQRNASVNERNAASRESEVGSSNTYRSAQIEHMGYENMLTNAKTQTEWNRQDLMNSEIFRNYASGVSSGADAVSNLIKGGLSLYGGLK